MAEQQQSDHSAVSLATRVEGLIPYVSEFIVNTWDWRPWMSEPPAVPLAEGGPAARPPGFLSDSTWTISFEGAYPWAIGFTHATNHEGPLKQYLDEQNLVVDCQAGYAISVTGGANY